MDYKTEMIKELLEKFPNASTLSLAKILHENNPLDFPSIENARGALRYWRGEARRSAKEPVSKRTEEEKKAAYAWAKLPESDYKEAEPFVMPRGQNRILLLTDIHLPYHDIDALSLALHWGLIFWHSFVKSSTVLFTLR